MRNKLFTFAALTSLLMGCQSQKTTNQNQAVGETHKVQETEQIGSAVHVLNREDMEILHRINVKTLHKIEKGQTLEVNDVIALQHSGIESEAMIQLLVMTHSHFQLTTADIIKLQGEGVPFRVINFMIRT